MNDQDINILNRRYLFHITLFCYVKRLGICFRIRIKSDWSFLFCLWVGLKIDEYFDSQPIALLICLLLSFIYVIKLLLGVGKHE